MLDRFLKLARHRNEEWASDLVCRFKKDLRGKSPATWDVVVSRRRTPAVFESLTENAPVKIGTLCLHPRDRNARLRCIPLMLARGNEDILLPEPDHEVQRGDVILFCGPRGSDSNMEWTLNNRNVLDYLLTGRARPTGIAWLWLLERLSGSGHSTRKTQKMDNHGDP